MSELLHGKLASFFHLQPLLVEGGRVPSILNGGLQHVNPFFGLGVLGVAGLFEVLDMMNKDDSSIFDPLNVFNSQDEVGKEWMEVAELKNGRVAMLAITAFAGIEAFTHHAVV